MAHLCLGRLGRPSVSSLPLIVACNGIQPQPVAWTWISLRANRHLSRNVDIGFGMIFDSAFQRACCSSSPELACSCISFLIGYMTHDPGRGRFFGGLSIFMFSMTGITLISTNLIEMFFFWEGVGSQFLPARSASGSTRESAAAGREQGFHLQSPGRFRLYDRHPHLSGFSDGNGFRPSRPIWLAKAMSRITPSLGKEASLIIKFPPQPFRTPNADPRSSEREGIKFGLVDRS